MNAFQKLFFRLFIPIALILLGGVWLYGQQDIDHKLRQLHNQEILNVRLGAKTLSSKIAFLTTDLLFLSKHNALGRAINQRTKINLNDLAEDFTTFSASKQIYNQIRWIDETGMEMVRVDNVHGHPLVVSSERLQNKQQRYYFSDTFKLNPGEVFISPFDLNVEQKKIEVPYRPMIRLATPVIDRQGKKRGIIILNYSAAEMLESFTRTTIDNARHIMLLNKEGYWLKNSNPENEWGFMLKRPDMSMAVQIPSVWNKISASSNGHLSVDSSFWAWRTVYPLLSNQKTSTATPEANGSSRHPLDTQQYYWKVVSHLSKERLDAIQPTTWLKLSGITSLLLIIFGLGSWKLAQAWILLADAETNFRTVADFTYDWETWITPTGDYRYCSPSCKRITGHSADEFINNPNLLFDITHPDDQTLVSEHFKMHASMDDLCEFSFRMILPDGQIQWIEHACVTVFGDTKEYLGRRAVNRNITKRIQAEKSLRENESRLIDMFENLKSGVIIYQVSPDGYDFIITSFNQAAERIEHVKREELIGKNLLDVFPSVKKFGIFEIFQRVWKNGVAEHFPISFYQDNRISGWRENYIYKLSNGDIVAIYDDITKEKQAEEKLKYIANHDQLTGLPNRQMLSDRALQAIRLAKRNKSHMALLFLDLDEFKPVNDAFGHDVGDLLLKEVAKRIEDCVRETDTVSRIGGDEFVILLSDIKIADDAMQIAENIRFALQQPLKVIANTIQISSSIGIAVYPQHGDNIKILSKRADLAMYHAKNSGRNNTRLYQPDMTE